MESNKKNQRKRKSAGLGDIFEVDDKDLSPEPEEIGDEPEAKILKTRNSDIFELRQNNLELNLQNEEMSNTKTTYLSKKLEVLCKSDKNYVDESDSASNKNDTEAAEALEDILKISSISEEYVTTEPSSHSPVSVNTSDENVTVMTEPLLKPLNLPQNLSDTTPDENITKAIKLPPHSPVSVTTSDENITVISEPLLKPLDSPENFTYTRNLTKPLLNSPGGVIISTEKVTNITEPLLKPTNLCDNTSRGNSTKTTESLPNSLNLSDELLEDGEVNDAILDETVLSSGPLEPSITIKFDSRSVADIYKSIFIKFIRSFIELEVQNLDDTTINVFRNVDIDSKNWVVLDSSNTPSQSIKKEVEEIEAEEELAKELPMTPKNESPKKKKKKKKQKLEQKELFVVDTNPAIDIHKFMPTKYSTKFLINDEKQEEPQEINKRTAMSTCFNCGKDHSLKECPEPKNYGKISVNRQKFANKNKTSRYHLEEEQKYGHLHPGKISQALRKALGLQKNQIPSFIYQMRIVGYPPGWLEEAKVVESELAMFDIDGNNVKNTNYNRIKGLDPEKVISYPGFNIPMEKNFRDEYKYYRVPPYSEDFSKEKMIEYIRKKCLLEEDNLETQDMDLDNTNEFVVVDTIEECMVVPATQPTKLDSIIDSDSNNVPSPSLKELEKQKKSLLEELRKPEEPIPWEFQSEDASLSSTGEQKESSEDSKKEKNQMEKLKPEELTKAVCEITETAIKIQISESAESRSSSPPSTINSIKHSTYGTPILKSSSPYNHLPNPDNFSKGVSPVIDFENLPNSTGKYEQMTGLLQRVRETLKKVQQKTST